MYNWKEKINRPLSLVLILGSLYSGTKAFDAPTCGDPWYYQDDNIMEFWVPDKIQHYWGSYALTEIFSKNMGKIPGAMTAFTAGFLWEVKDSKTSLGTPSGGVVGFSYRDLIADGLGVLSSSLNSKRLIMYAEYSVLHKEITFNFSWRF